MRKILLGSAVLLALLTGCNEEKKPVAQAEATQEVKKDEVIAVQATSTEEVKEDEAAEEVNEQAEENEKEDEIKEDTVKEETK